MLPPCNTATGQPFSCASEPICPSEEQRITSSAVGPRRKEPVAVQVVSAVSRTPSQRIQADCAPIASPPPGGRPGATGPTGSLTSWPYKQFLRDERLYLLNNLPAKSIYDTLWSYQVISDSMKDKMKAAPSQQQACQLLIQSIEQAPDTVPWNGLLAALQSRSLQADCPILKNVLAHMASYADKTAAPAVVQEPPPEQKPICARGVALGSCNSNPLPPHQLVLKQKWTYLTNWLPTQNIADHLFSMDGDMSYDLYQRIAHAATRVDANKILLEYLFAAKNNIPLEALLKVLGSYEVRQDYPVAREVYRVIMNALSSHNSR